MSKAGKISFIFSFVALVILFGGRLVYGGWHDALWVPFALTFLLFIVGMVKDHRAIREFFGMRTTKHGLNMGALILIAIAGLACVNLLAVRYQKKFDWTSEGLNSLSDQSVKAAMRLQANTEVVLLYRKDSEDVGVQQGTRDLVAMYRNVTDKIKFNSYSALKRPDLAQKFELKGGYGVYVVQGDKRLKVDPTTEEGLTRALIKLGRAKSKSIYFTTGHGERLLEDKTDAGLSNLQSELSVTYDVKSLVLFQSDNKVPSDAAAVAIVGPEQQFTDAELNGLRDYARNGGSLFIAIDPGRRHNLAQLAKTLGVEFNNDYVLDLRSQVVQGGPTMVLGTEFPKTNEITRAFDTGMLSLFLLTSSLRPAPGLPESITVDEIVKTDGGTASVYELEEKTEYRPNGPHVLGVLSRGIVPTQAGEEVGQSAGESAASSAATTEENAQTAEPEKTATKKKFTAVIFGDSDFASNSLIHNNLNRDLVANAFASLTNDQELISIRPKEPKATKLDMTRQDFMILVIFFILPLPILLFIFGGIFWWRRRTA